MLSDTFPFIDDDIKSKNQGPTSETSVGQEAGLSTPLVNQQTDNDPKCVIANTPSSLRGEYSSKNVTEEGLNVVNEALYSEQQTKTIFHTTNGLSHSLQYALRKRTYNFDKSEKILSELNKEIQARNNGSDGNGEESETGPDPEPLEPENDIFENELEIVNEDAVKDNIDVRLGAVFDNCGIKQRSEEKKKIDWRGKLILAPMTTLGNLPFRRMCKSFGVDVTISEMAMASYLLQGKPQEWDITKRHESEDIFGVQVCGGSATLMTKCAQLLQEQTDVDFLDLNAACPIELICNQGAGCALLNRKKVLFSIVKSMKSVMDIPLSMKLRMGLFTGQPMAHTLMRGFSIAGADVIMIHGRSKEQRYTKVADWDYIEQCAQLAAPAALVGNGDILSYEDYDIVREKSPTAAAVMIGRGALIKPWIFTEIKERRHWDISSQERFQILRKYTDYGLEHWGSDTKGVESTRRYLLEWLSFLYRYMPVGLMEKPPQKMNERVPKFEGRDELECLMASPNSTDWIKISEMLLGPAPDGFQFIPKHKANAWSPNQ